MYRLQDKKNRNRNKKTIVIAIFLFLIIFSFIYIIKNGALHFLGFPLWRAKVNTEQVLSDNSYLLRTKESVFKKNRELLIENINLNNLLLEYDILKKENLELKELLGRKDLEENFILANILVKPTYSPYDSIIIDVGENYNLKIGDKIYASLNIPIGEVEKVYSKSSSVVLYSSPGVSTIGMIEDLNTNIEIIGRGGGNFEMTTPVDIFIEKGKKILIPNINTEIFAIVGDIISDSHDPIKKFILSAPVNVQNLKWVQVKLDN